MNDMKIFWSDGRPREIEGVGHVVSGVVLGERGCPGARVAPGLRMVDILLDREPAPNRARSITVCIADKEAVAA